MQGTQRRQGQERRQANRPRHSPLAGVRQHLRTLTARRHGRPGVREQRGGSRIRPVVRLPRRSNRIFTPKVVPAVVGGRPSARLHPGRGAERRRRGQRRQAGAEQGQRRRHAVHRGPQAGGAGGDARGRRRRHEHAAPGHAGQREGQSRAPRRAPDELHDLLSGHGGCLPRRRRSTRRGAGSRGGAQSR